MLWKNQTFDFLLALDDCGHNTCSPQCEWKWWRTAANLSTDNGCSAIEYNDSVWEYDFNDLALNYDHFLEYNNIDPSFTADCMQFFVFRKSVFNRWCDALLERL